MGEGFCGHQGECTTIADDFSSFLLNSFRKKWNARLLPNCCLECERGPGVIATRRLHEPEVDELFRTHLLVSPPHAFFWQLISIGTSSSVKLAGLSLEFLDLVRGCLTRRVASQPLLAE